MSEMADLLALAKATVTAAAGAVARADRAQLQSVLRVELAGKETKLAADEVLEAAIVPRLLASGLPVLSEESGVTGVLGDGKYWVVDPLDGTVNFFRGAGPSAISVALCDAGRPALGLIYRLDTRQLSWGGPGLGAWTDDRPITVSETARAEEGIVCAGFPARFDPATLPEYFATLQRFAKVRMLGSAACALLMVARGEVDAYYEDRIMFWDVAAGIALVRGAGGEVRVTAAAPDDVHQVVATNSRVTVTAS
jgi:myo-inositol-1(or 4)-monophosphatase